MKSAHFYTLHLPSKKPEIFDNTNIIMYQKVAKICVLQGGDWEGENWGTLHFC